MSTETCVWNVTGTVEYLYVPSTDEFYFLEVCAHPVRYVMCKQLIG